MDADRPSRERLKEVVRLFTRLGFTAFGGPAAHLALMRDEVVTRRGWVTDEEYLDIVGAANMVPGPNSTETALHLGFRRAGYPGLVAAGLCFILPATWIVVVLAWVYQRYGMLPPAEGVMAGMKPAVVAVVLAALIQLGRPVLRAPLPVGVAVLACGLSMIGVPEIWLVFVPGLLIAANQRRRSKNTEGGRTVFFAAVGVIALIALASLASTMSVSGGGPTASGVFLAFLKVGSVLYGSGYVLLSYLNTDLVARLGWLTQAQLLDGVAVGQFTPGPVFTTAGFLGYLLGGVPGALLATVGIFLPSFVFVALSGKLVGEMRRSEVARAFLLGVNSASLGLLGAVVIKLGRAAIFDTITAALALLALFALVKLRMNSVWVMLAGGTAGLLLHVLKAT